MCKTKEFYYAAAPGVLNRTVICQLCISLALAVAAMEVLVCVLGNAGAKLDRPLHQLGALSQPRQLGRTPQDAFVPHSLRQLQVGDLTRQGVYEDEQAKTEIEDRTERKERSKKGTNITERKKWH